MRDIKLTILRIGTGLFSLIAIITGARLLIIGAQGALGDAAADLATPPALAGLDNDLRFLASCWLVVGVAMAIGAAVPRRKPDFILIGLVVVVLGGFARLYGFTEYGPLPEEFGPIAIEFLGGIPLLVLYYFWRGESEPVHAGNLEAQTGN